MTGTIKLPREAGDWELVSEGINSFTQRLPVPGGWLYRTAIKENAVALCFVPGLSAVEKTQ